VPALPPSFVCFAQLPLLSFIAKKVSPLVFHQAIPSPLKHFFCYRSSKILPLSGQHYWPHCQPMNLGSRLPFSTAGILKTTGDSSLAVLFEPAQLGGNALSTAKADSQH
jgi:hypothetical protein